VTDQAYFYGTGRRKCAIARVRLIPGGDTIIVNGKPLEEAFSQFTLHSGIMEPFRVTGTLGKFNTIVKVEGGGISGQAGAIRHGIARALLKADETHRSLLRSYGLLTRDPRVKERKKYGLKRARKAPQYTKR
jgi:small subunit ribosomal protein S9